MAALLSRVSGTGVLLMVATLCCEIWNEGAALQEGNPSELLPLQLNWTSMTIQALRADLNTRNYVRQVRNASYTRVDPTPFHSPVSSLTLAAVNPDLLERLGISLKGDPEWDNTFKSYFSGNKVPMGSLPFANAYGGHQFGYWAGQLGDGRAVSLGELKDISGRSLEVQLKGSGKTPYSRRGDGRGVLESALREFLSGDALVALGVPSSRSLAVVSSMEERSDRIYRDEAYNGNGAARFPAVLTRTAPSFIRIGSFQLASKRQGPRGLYQLSKFYLKVIRQMDLHDDDSTRYFDDAIQRLEDAGRITEDVQQSFGSVRETCFLGKAATPTTSDEGTLRSVLYQATTRLAALAAAWESVGFTHGVLNTDNVSPLGITIDMNVFGYINRLDNMVANLIDDEGRYSFFQQTAMVKWDLHRLADALSGSEYVTDRETDAKTWMFGDGWDYDKKSFPFLDAAEAHEIVEEIFDRSFDTCYNARLKLRLGLLPDTAPSTTLLVKDWKQFLKTTEVDYHALHRQLKTLEPKMYMLDCDQQSVRSILESVAMTPEASNSFISVAQVEMFSNLLVRLFEAVESLWAPDAVNGSTQDGDWITQWQKHVSWLNPDIIMRTAATKRIINNAVGLKDFRPVATLLRLLQAPFNVDDQHLDDRERQLAHALSSIPDGKDALEKTSCGAQ